MIIQCRSFYTINVDKCNSIYMRTTNSANTGIFCSYIFVQTVYIYNLRIVVHTCYDINYEFEWYVIFTDRTLKGKVVLILL